ncbi:single-stranded DNA-binding protein [Salinisphaera sp. G21_0]|uniref:single-stranded DNA-binding protein n=1 Tax=Salinisphaera sp. G21_0 TaxID=2821094 RepID=UPI001AD9B1DB|nr:single-stranded DNA-binding protein [Salinisphaera sp. G21_0]MBO9484264.1 single-stranded DNA-binding protein [Salinisphaera sp. G21_0]
MVASMNRVTLIGRLGRDPDCKATANGDAVTILSLATEESWKKDGQKQTRTDWHRVVLYGKTAELAAQYLAKGHRVMIEGQLQTRKWQDQNGQDRYQTEVVHNGFNGKLLFLEKNPNNQQPQQTQTQPQQRASQNQYANARNGATQQPGQSHYEQYDEYDSSIPF